MKCAQSIWPWPLPCSGASPSLVSRTPIEKAWLEYGPSPKSFSQWSTTPEPAGVSASSPDKAWTVLES